jgi:hypothetical protein
LTSARSMGHITACNRRPPRAPSLSQPHPRIPLLLPQRLGGGARRWGLTRLPPVGIAHLIRSL